MHLHEQRLACCACRLSHRPGEMAQWAWAQDSPRKGGQQPRVLLMVREAVLLNSLKRLMVAVPIYEAAINKWTGGAAAPPPGAPQGGLRAEFSCEDVAPHVGAQFAQVRAGPVARALPCVAARACTPTRLLCACVPALLRALRSSRSCARSTRPRWAARASG